MLSVVLILLFIFYLVMKRSQRPRFYPPGPPPLPIVGNLISVWLKRKEVKYYHEIWRAWAEEYGDLLGLRLGVANVVVVSGKDMIREVSTREVFDGRPDGLFYLTRTFGKKMGLVFTDGQEWARLRKMVTKYLKTFGFGTRYMEALIGQECKALVDLRLTDAGQAVPVDQMFNIPVVNILWKLVAGKRYDFHDKTLKDLCKLIKKSFALADMSGGMMNYMPYLKHIAPGLIGYTEMKECYASIYDYLRNVIKEHQDTLDASSPRDVIDHLIIEMNKENSLTYEELQAVCLDLLQAGMETVGNTVVFMVLHLVRSPAVQAQLQRELDEVVGHRRPPGLNDRNTMVYAEAVVLESLRISTVPAVGIPHMALDDARLGDYVIPKGTFMIFSMYDLHNGSHWKDPDTFRPERFLTKEGNIIQDDWLMPFGTGKRRCLGELLSRSELFLFLTYILQKFTLKVPDGEPMPSTEHIEGVSLQVKPFNVVFEPRYGGKRAKTG